jgi:hypothetical protein
MMITAEWFSPQQTAVIVTARPPWAWEDFYALQQRHQKTLDTLDHMVDLIIDFTHSGKLPPNAFRHLRTLRLRAHPNRGLVIMVGFNPYLQTVLNVLAQLNPTTTNRLRLVGTMAEATRLVQESQQTRAKPA